MWRILILMLNSSSNLMWFWTVLITWMLDGMSIAFALLLKFLWLKVVLLVFWDRWGDQILQLHYQNHSWEDACSVIHIIVTCLCNPCWCHLLYASSIWVSCYICQYHLWLCFWPCDLFFLHNSFELLVHTTFCPFRNFGWHLFFLSMKLQWCLLHVLTFLP